MITAVPLPAEYRLGVREQAIATRPAPAFLLGHRWVGRRWWFVPGSLIVKLTASALATMALGFACWYRLRRRAIFEALLTVAAPLAVLGGFLFFGAQNLGLRYWLPIIALAGVAAGPAVSVLRRGHVARLGIGLLALTQLYWLWASVPHSLAWTAPPFRPGYRYASDSNLDWGQDGYRLESWIRRHRDAVVLYFGASPIEWKPVPGGVASQPGWYAISATFVKYWAPPSLGGYLVLLGHCPVGTIGGTILLWHFDRPPDLRVHPTYRVPPICHGRFSAPVRR
jgi:hypothetical protein